MAMITRGGLLLVGVLAVGCASTPEPLGEPATTAFAGTEVRVETWHATAAKDRSLRPRARPLSPTEQMMVDAQTGFQAISMIADAAREDPERTPEEKAGSFAGSLGKIVSGRNAPFGTPYGGPGRLALGLRRYTEESEVAVAGLFLDMPSLAAGERERLVTAPDLLARYHEPILDVKASLESGWVRVRRLDGDRTAFHVAVVLREKDSDARIHIVAHVEVPSP